MKSKGLRRKPTKILAKKTGIKYCKGRRRMTNLNQTSKLEKMVQIIKKLKSKIPNKIINSSSENTQKMFRVEEKLSNLSSLQEINDNLGNSKLDITWNSTKETEELWNLSVSEEVFMETSHTEEEFQYSCDNISKIKCFPISKTAVIVVMQLNSILAFRGKVSLQVLKGCVEILGYQITSTSEMIPVSSPGTDCALTITSLIEKEHPCEVVHSNIFSQFQLDSEIQEELQSFIQLNDNCTIFVLHKDKSLLGQFVKESYRKLFFPKPDENLANIGMDKTLVNFIPIEPNSDSVLKIPDNWRDIENELKAEYFEKGNPIRVLVCGGKNTGKSTLIRYLINSFLTKCGEVCLLDGDPGQAECTPCGCLSLVKINQPLLGPPFTHYQQPFKSYFAGGANITECPDHYLACLQKLNFDFNSQDKESLQPLFINTMGWTSGLGLHLFVDTIVITKPTHVIQLTRGNSKVFNFERLTPQYILEQKGWLTNPATQLQSNYVLLDIPAVRSGKETIFTSSELRDLGIIAYFGQMQNQFLNHMKPIHAYTPYKIQWSAFGICIFHEKIPFHQALYALNGSLVALGICDPSLFLKSKDESLPKFLINIPICQCVGYAIIRGISMEEKSFYFITPVPWNQLKNVNVLLKGDMKLPEKLLHKQIIEGNLPYMMEETKKTLGREPVRGRKFRRRKNLI